MIVDLDSFVPYAPTDCRQSPEVGLADLVVEAWIYRESTARFSEDGYKMSLPREWPPPVEQHPDWHVTYAEDLANHPYLAGLVNQAHGDLGVVYAGVKLSKREAQVFGLRLSGLTWGAIADEISISRSNATTLYDRARRKFEAVCANLSGVRSVTGVPEAATYSMDELVEKRWEFDTDGNSYAPKTWDWSRYDKEGKA